MGLLEVRSNRFLIWATVILRYGVSNTMHGALIPILPRILAHTWYNKSNTTDIIDTWRLPEEDTDMVGIVLGTQGVVRFFVNLLLANFLYVNLGNRNVQVLSSVVMAIAGTVLSISMLCGDNMVYALLLLGRALHGIGHGCSTVAVYKSVTLLFPDKRAYGCAVTLLLGAMQVGYLLAPTYGSLTYAAPLLTQHHDVDVYWTFGILTALFVVLAVVTASLIWPTETDDELEHKSILVMLSRHNAPLLIVMGILAMTNFSISTLQGTLPSHMDNTMTTNVSEKMTAFQTSFVFIPDAFMYNFGLFGVSALAHTRIATWVTAFVAMCFNIVALVSVSFCTSVFWLLIPDAVIGLTAGISDMIALISLKEFLKIRSHEVHGPAWALYGTIYYLGWWLGPLLGGFVVSYASFRIAMCVTAGIIALYLPSLYFLKFEERKVRETETRELNDQAINVFYKGIEHVDE